jgi:hypothetical protein
MVLESSLKRRETFADVALLVDRRRLRGFRGTSYDRHQDETAYPRESL